MSNQISAPVQPTFLSTVKNLLEHVPIPTAGVALGLAALGNLLQPFSAEVRLLCGSLAFALVVLVLAKIFVHPNLIRNDFRNSILASVSATLFMTLMQLATYLAPLAYIPAFALWLTAIVAHAALIVWFTRRYIANFKLQEVFPTYFICYVGIVVASVTSPTFAMQPLGFALFVFGFICYIVLLAVVTYRYAKHEIPEGAKPLFCIYTAPMSLSLAGYLATAESPNAIFVGVLLVLGQVLLVLVLTQLPKFIKLNFYPSFAAMTFPFVITATALYKAQSFFVANGVALHPVVDTLLIGETLLAVAMVAFVFVKYMGFFAKKTRETLAVAEKELVAAIEKPLMTVEEEAHSFEESLIAGIPRTAPSND